MRALFQVEPIKVYCGGGLYVDYLKSESGKYIVPLFRSGEVEPIELRFAVRCVNAPTEAYLHLPEKAKAMPLEFVSRTQEWETIISGLRRHAVISWKAG